MQAFFTVFFFVSFVLLFIISSTAKPIPGGYPSYSDAAVYSHWRCYATTAWTGKKKKY